MAPDAGHIAVGEVAQAQTHRGLLRCVGLNRRDRDGLRQHGHAVSAVADDLGRLRVHDRDRRLLAGLLAREARGVTVTRRASPRVSS